MTTLAPPETSDDPAALFRRYRDDGDRDAHAALVRRYMPLVHRLALRYRGLAELDDLQQVASIALLKSIDRFEPDRGLAFTSFAVPTILGELKRYFRDYGWSVRVPRAIKELKLSLDAARRTLGAELGRAPTPRELAEHTGSTLEQVLEALAADTAHRADSLDRPLSEDGDTAGDLLGGGLDPGFSQAEDATYVHSLMAVLTERERLLLRLRFEEDLTQDEIGERLGVSQMQVSRLIRRAIAQLQSAAAGPQSSLPAGMR